MPAITARPIINSWAQNTANKDTPSQTVIGDGIEFAAPLISSEPNGAFYIIYEAAKNLQRTGGMYSPLIPYIAGQSCSLLCKMGTFYSIRRFVCISATDITATPPVAGATVTTVEGVDVYSGGLLDSTNWSDADYLEGYAPTTLSAAYDGTVASVAGFAAVTVGTRQYVSVTNSTLTTVNPDTARSSFMKAPTLDEVLAMMDGIVYPKWAAMAASIATYPIRRLGVYRFRGQVVEAFGMFLAGAAFTDNSTSNQSKFWRSMSSVYSTLCVANNTSLRDYLFSGTEGGTITPKNYQGRVETCVGTPTLTAGTAAARAALGAVQDDQVQGHWHDQYYQTATSLIAATGNGMSAIFTNNLKSSVNDGIRDPRSDLVNGTTRTGLNTRENTFSVPVPMVVSLLPYGSISL